MSRVTCHVSHVTCHMSHVTIFVLFFGQSGEADRGRVCYQRGLPRLVFLSAAKEKLFFYVIWFFVQYVMYEVLYAMWGAMATLYSFAVMFENSMEAAV